MVRQAGWTWPSLVRGIEGIPAHQLVLLALGLPVPFVVRVERTAGPVALRAERVAALPDRLVSQLLVVPELAARPNEVINQYGDRALRSQADQILDHARRHVEGGHLVSQQGVRRIGRGIEGLERGVLVAGPHVHHPGDDDPGQKTLAQLG